MDRMNILKKKNQQATELLKAVTRINGNNALNLCSLLFPLTTSVSL